MYRLRPRLRFPEQMVGDPFEQTRVERAETVIRSAREWSDLSQAEIGRRMGIQRQTISAWERGLQSPSFDAVMRLLGACEMDLVVIPFARESDFDFAPARCLIPGRTAIPRSADDRWLRRVRENRALITQYRAEKEGYGRGR